MANRHDRYAYGASIVLALGVVGESYRLFDPWPGISPVLSRVLSAVLITLFVVTAMAIILRRRNRVFAGLGWVLTTLTPVLMVAHGAATRVAGSTVGLVYWPLAAALIFTLKRTLDSGEWSRLPTKDPGGRPGGAERGYRVMPRPRG
jgi:hypothetical protein